MRPQVQEVAAVDISAPIIVNYRDPDFAIGFAVTLTAGATLTYSVQHTLDDPADFASAAAYETDADWFDHEDIVGIVDTSNDGNYAYPIRAVRLNVTAYTDGTAKLTVLQST